MKQFSKSLIAVALMAAAGAANASIAVTTTGDNDAFLVVYDANYAYADGTKGRTYNLDLNVTFNNLFNNGAASAFAAFTGAGKDLSTDANWVAFSNGMSTTGVKYALVSGDSANSGNTATHTVYLSGTSTSPVANIDPTVLIGDAADIQSQAHAVEINLGLATGADSSLIKQSPDNGHGQADHTALGVPFQGLWGGLNYSNLVSYGSTSQFWRIGSEVVSIDDGSGLGPVDTTVTLQGDITNVGAWTLANNNLKFVAPGVVTTVPLPAAVWMFGAAVMGFLGLNRRKAA